MNRISKIAFIGKECEAFGCCAAICPREAIRIVSGVRAQIDKMKCVGCGKCAQECPAAVITINKREDVL